MELDFLYQAAGTNDLMRHHDVDILWRDVSLFSNIVQLHGYERNMGKVNSFAMATLPYVPKLCWLSNGTPPPPGFICHYDRMKQFNDRVLRTSHRLEVGVDDIGSSDFLDFSLMGTRQLDPSGNGGPSTLRSDYGQWREAMPWRMIHLNDKNRILMASRVTAYFAALSK